MNADELTPFRLAQLLRNLADARAQNHPIAIAIDAAGPLPEIAAAAWFEHLRQGNLRCDFRPEPGLPPCTADGIVAISNQAKAHDQIFFCCLEHFPHFRSLGESRFASVDTNKTLLRHYALSLQAALRQLHQSPVYDLALARQVNVLKAQIQRRLTSANTRPGPSPSNHHGAL